jgi:DNA polymerase-3 subunit alpha
VNKRVLESLIRSGAFDSTNRNRARLFVAIDTAIESGQRLQRSRATGQTDLFGALASSGPAAEPPLPESPEWPHQELLKGEKETLGFYISGHPLLRYEEALADFANANVDRLSSFYHGAQVTIGGVVMEMNVRTTKKGDRFALFQLEDQFGSVKVVAWPDVFGKANGHMQNDAAILVKGRLEVDDGGSMTVIADEIQALENIRERSTRTVIIRFSADAISGDCLKRLHDLLDKQRGDAGIIFEVELNDGSVARVQPNQFVRVKVTPDLTNKIKEIIRDCNVELVVQRATGAAR